MISPDIHILTTTELEAIKHAEYRRGRKNAFDEVSENDKTCHASRGDGECFWELCPQHRDNEPMNTGRNCPYDRPEDDTD